MAACLRCSVAMSVAVLLALAGTVVADANSRGNAGIRATGLGLNGQGVTIGQVEPGRIGLAGTDNAGNSHVLVQPTSVWTNGLAPIANFAIDNHALGVAGTMISTGPVTAGVAQGASLVSASISRGFSDETFGAPPSAWDTFGRFIAPNSAIQRVLDQGATIVNHSWGGVPVGFRAGAGGSPPNAPANPGVMNNQSQLTLMIDWSARRYNALHVVAGNETGPAQYSALPTDMFNGMNVSALELNGGQFTRISNYNIVNNLPTDGRRSTVDICAPGTNLDLVDLPSSGNPFYVGSGTSFAAPHVSATGALLTQRAAQLPLVNIAGQNHQSLKALMMNSADKVSGILGMDRTITRGNTRTVSGAADPAGNNNDWLQQRTLEVGNGVNRDFHPLDTQLGTGAINASRAKINLDYGNQLPNGAIGGGNIDWVGWNYYTVGGSGVGTAQAREYTFNANLQANEWVSITLAWDRRVTLTNNTGAANHFDGEYYIEQDPNASPNFGTFSAGDILNDTNGNNTYEANLYDTFASAGLQDLDLELVNSAGLVVLRSISTAYSVEHIFGQVPANDRYTIRVSNFGGPIADEIAYGLAWWTKVPAPGAAALFALAGALAARRRRA